ncbi:MAG: inositol monophosphatase family protein [Bacilli bacterium]|nr:inositol monophosphatase family protein [Bacilli bacterium]MBN2876309.1 inositol monophosphatase family protein [Bacilli bacterium]
MNYKKELELLQEIVPVLFQKTEDQEKEISYKKRNEIVTSSDLFMEKGIIDAVLKQFPNDHFHSEEFNRDTELGDRTWLIDPIDGTSNYAHHLDMFVSQIALYDKGEIVLSYIHAPRVHKTFYAIKGEGAYLNGERISVFNDEGQPNRLMSMVGLSHQTTKDKYLFRHFIDFAYQNDIKIRVLGTMGYEMAAMAEGSFAMLYTDVTNYWDIAPGILLVQEAGGVIINQFGKPYKLNDEHMIVCCDETLKEHVIRTLPNAKH